jgi:ribonuclease HIII
MSIATARKHLGSDSNQLSDDKIQEIIYNLEKLSVLTYDIYIEQERKKKSLGNSEGHLPERGA